MSRGQTRRWWEGSDVQLKHPNHLLQTHAFLPLCSKLKVKTLRFTSLIIASTRGSRTRTELPSAAATRQAPLDTQSSCVYLLRRCFVVSHPGWFGSARAQHRPPLVVPGGAAAELGSLPVSFWVAALERCGQRIHRLSVPDRGAEDRPLVMSQMARPTPS